MTTMRIVDLASFFVGLAHEDDARAGFGMEEAFHGGHGGGLMARDVFTVQVAGGKDDEDGGDDAGDDADAGEDASVVLILSIEQIERANGGHDE